jgi:hypothetical protein
MVLYQLLIWTMSGKNLLKRDRNKESGNRFEDILKKVSQVMISLTAPRNMEIKKIIRMPGPSSLTTLSTTRSNFKHKVKTNHMSRSTKKPIFKMKLKTSYSLPNSKTTFKSLVRSMCLYKRTKDQLT